MTMLKIPEGIYAQMIALAREGFPLEVCGILGGQGDRVAAIHPMTNADASGEHFSLEPAEQFAVIKALRAANLEMLAVYHSHPATPARPSEEDIRLARTPGISYVIVSLADHAAPTVRSFKVAAGKAELEELEILAEGFKKAGEDDV